jgi:uncharacterized membrane protein
VPPPPPGFPQQPYQPPSSGINKKTGAILSYVLGWITGVIFLFVGKDDPDVKYHAAQSTVFFGGLTVLYIIVDIVQSIIHPLFFVLWLIDIYAFIMWIFCLIQANNGQGARFRIPLLGDVVTPYADQLASSVT